MKKSETLNLLMNCEHLLPFDEKTLSSTDDKTRRMEFMLSWRKTVFIKGYVGKHLVFLAYLPLREADALRDAFNSIKSGHFVRYADTMREAMNRVGLGNQDLFEMTAFKISDLNAANIIIDGCIVLDFSETKAKLTGESFAVVIDSLYDNLCSECRTYERSHDAAAELAEANRKYSELLAKSEKKLDDSDKNALCKQVTDMYETWSGRQYLALSPHGDVRDLYAKIIAAQKTLVLNLSSSK